MTAPSYVTSAKQKIARNLPFYIGRFFQTLLYGIWLVVGFIKQVIQDAIGH